jgi:hypothetical protein
LTAINAKDKTTAFRAFLDNYARADPVKQFKNEKLHKILEEFIRRTPQLKNLFF